mmetsp:Transcript_1120/g.2322  ORF Transcript_1120/g.2322 Transcript_1120/m.2322 type:complete len:219 (-) Transcript_1120:147-803(-)
MGAGGAKGEDNDPQPGMDELSMSDPEWARVADLLQEYSTFKVTKVWRVRPCARFQEYASKAAALGRPTQLFHGTSHAAACKIAKEGFRLPRGSGLYGPGLYFAENPNKSASYAPERSWSPFFRRWAAQGCFAALCGEKEHGQMLVCDVYLGRYKRAGGSSCIKDPAKDLQGGWFRQLLGLGDYDSVYAAGWFFHSEYVVYQEHQAVPRYLIEFDYVRS